MVGIPVLDGILIVSTESVIMQACLSYIIVVNLLQFEGNNTAGSKEAAIPAKGGGGATSSAKKRPNIL